ncbi:family 43 glycosylhydrolase [Polymorphospora rubra]|uniref:family 43 glycosylhydrolase n=1 Tax=Polymorphospora rubra TaxID=338584 RepID=UPI0033DC7EB2
MPPISEKHPGRARRRWRTGLAAGVVIVVVGTATAVAMPAASAATADTNAYYVLVNRHSGKALDVYNLATHDGAPINQYARNDGAWQQWRFLDAGNGYYRVQSRHSGKVLELPNADDGVQLVQNADNGSTRQHFRLADSAGGHVRLINRHSGKALDVWEWSTADGAKVSQYQDLDGNNQQWRMVNLGPVVGTPGSFTNPIKRNGPDPWLQHHNGFYYLATTTWNSTITMRRSSTLGGLFGAPEQVVFDLSGRPNGCCNMWAPEFHLLDGPNGRRWYLYYVAGQNVSDFNPTQRLHVLESAGTDPMGPYTFKADLGGDWQLDASVLKVNGNLYLLGTYNAGSDGQSLFITPLSNPWTLGGSRVRLTSPTLSWERQTHPVAEGPEPLYHNGRTMIVYSASACWGPDYKLGLLTLTGSNPLNPSSWTKHPTPVFQRSDANGVYAPGHNGFFKSPDGTEDWIVYHANDSAGGGCDMNRSTRAQKFTWNADGTPNFGTPVRLGVQLPAPSGE